MSFASTSSHGATGDPDGSQAIGGWRQATQYTAIDVASAYAWAELHTSERNPRSQPCQRLLHRVAAELTSLARSPIPKSTALTRELDEYLNDYNTDRPHTGRLTQGRVPGDIVYAPTK